MPKIAVRTITPRVSDIIDWDKINAELRSALKNQVAPLYKREFEKTVRGWTSKPQFKSRVEIRRDQISVSIFPAGANRDKYIWVNDGVKARAIVPRPNSQTGRLVFQTGYRASTRPGMVWSFKSSRFGRWINPFHANDWPGIEPRHFDVEIAKDRALLEEFRRIVQNAINRATR